MDKNEIRRAAAAFAQALEGIEGKLPIERTARKQIELFRHLRDVGTPWLQIASTLSKAGVKRQDGRPISADQLRAMISRVERSLVTKPVTRAEPIETTVYERLARSGQGETITRPDSKRPLPKGKEDIDQATDYAEARRTMARASAARKT